MKDRDSIKDLLFNPGGALKITNIFVIDLFLFIISFIISMFIVFHY